MTPRARLLLDYINFYGRMVVNRRGCLSTAKTPELRWLLKRGHLRQAREGAWSIRHTCLYPTKPVKVEKLVCPDCKVDLSQHGALWETIVRGTSDYFSAAKHKYNCSLRLDHIWDYHTSDRDKRL